MFEFLKKEKRKKVMDTNPRTDALRLFLSSENAKVLTENGGFVVPCISMINTKEFVKIKVNDSLETLCATSTKKEFEMIYDTYKTEQNIDGYVDENIEIRLENGYIFNALKSEFDTKVISFKTAIDILKLTGTQYLTLFFENGDVVLLDEAWLIKLSKM